MSPLRTGILSIAAALAAGAAGAGSVATIAIEEADGPGSEIVRLAEPEPPDAPPAAGRGAGTVLWHRNLATSIYTSTGASGVEGVVFSGTYLNPPRQVETVPFGGNGTPDWMWSGTELFADASRDGDVLAAVDFQTADSAATIREWRPGSSTPLWSYVVRPCRSLTYQGWASRKPVRVSDDGSTIAVGITMWTAGGGQQGRLLVFDAGSGTPVVDYALPTGSIVATEITPDGRFVALASWPTVYVYDRSVPALRWSGAIGAGNDALAISGDGTYLAWGWTTFFLRQWDGAAYTPAWTYDPPGAYYVGQCALTADETGLAIAWDNGTTVPNEVSVELYELPSLAVQWTYDYGSASSAPPGGGLGLTDIPTHMRFSETGDRLAVASWGGEFPELHVFDRMSQTPVYTLDTPGSMIDLDVVSSAGGTRVAVCGKHTHSTISGNGGDSYAIEIPGPATAIAELPVRRVGLEASRPNPFRERTTISWSLARPGPVRLSVHDVQGRLVRELVRDVGAAGTASVTWKGVGADGAPVPAGVYFARLETADGVSTRKILALR